MVPVALSCARLLIVLLPCDARQTFDDVAVGQGRGGADAARVTSGQACKA